MQYKEAVNYLLTQLPMFSRVGAAAYRADLGNIIQLSELLGNPEKHLRCIHIAGTNGKGSVTHIIASVLQEAGYNVGVYTSPHYKDYRERIKINGKLISKGFVADFVAQYKDDFQHLNASFFEISNALAFHYFHAKKVDFAIIETGMGGRLDSTNIITPLLSVVTNISFDHQQFLGDTLPKIAKEKAGIIKEKIPVVIGEWQKETVTVFKETAKEKHAKLVFASREIELKNATQNANGIAFEWNNKKYKTDISGTYQLKNISTSLQAIETLKLQGVNISNKAITNGLKRVKENTYFIGRWTLIQKQPLVFFDSAHNEAGIRELTAQIAQLKYKKLHFVYGTVSDKDLSKIFPLFPKNAIYYCCKPDIPRGKNEQELADEFLKNKFSATAFSSVKKAYKTALKNAS
ncbi:MAG TPA: folylpolyglutamate synthase/dihydrofolate synthase family protein, partial [Chitinophagales bacterium]